METSEWQFWMNQIIHENGRIFQINKLFHLQGKDREQAILLAEISHKLDTLPEKEHFPHGPLALFQIAVPPEDSS